MNRRSVVFLITLFLTLALAIPSYAFFDSAVDKAEDFLKAKMVPQAIKVLEKEINEDPTNAEAHFLLGQCYLKEGRFRQAEERFESATALKSKYKDKVGQIYHSEGKDALQSGNTRKARILLDQAIKHQPSLKIGIAQTCLDRGHTDLAIHFNPSLQSQVCASLMDKAEKASDETCTGLYEKAARYCDKNSEISKKAGERLLGISKSLNGKRYKEYRKAAGKFIDVPPDYKVYENGKSKVFRLTEDQESDHYIRLQKEQMVSFHGPDHNYGIKFRSGKIVRVWNGEPIPKDMNEDFKIFAANGPTFVGLKFLPYDRNKLK